jgi:SAM-dependent methyltransferase
MADRWNHNTHFHDLVLRAVPPDARTALDVGTGNGLLAQDLADAGLEVTAIDLDETVLDAARTEHADAAIHWVRGDVMAADLGQQFDVVASVATVHHLPDLALALSRLADLTAPGGTLVVVGLARSTRLRDRLPDLVGVVQHRWYSWRHGYWEHSAPTCWPPPHPYSEVRRTAWAVLMGSRYRRHPLWRYSITWRRPR